MKRLALGDSVLRPLAAAWSLRDTPIACIGRIAVFEGARNADVALVFHDLVSDSTIAVMSLEGRIGPRLLWLPDEVPPAVNSLSIGPAPTNVTTGERFQLTTMAYWSDGHRAPFEPVWSSESPDVLSVSPGGGVVAVGAGSARVVARHQHWITDAIRINVSDAPSRGVLLTEYPHADWRRRWDVLGDPEPVFLEQEDGPVLSLEGDGMNLDMILSRESIDLSRGITLAVDFRLWPLSLTAGQRLAICLLEAERSETPSDQLLISDSACFSYPAAELAFFDPSRAVFNFLRIPMAVEVSVGQVLPTSDWVTVQITIRADGSAVLRLNGEVVAERDHAVQFTAESRWRVGIYGLADRTDLWVRNITVREGSQD